MSIRPLYLLAALLVATTIKSQHTTYGYYGPIIHPNALGFEHLYCGNIKFLPVTISELDKKRFPQLEATFRSLGVTDDNFAQVYRDARCIINEVALSKGDPCRFNYKFYRGYKNSPEDEIIVSVSSSGGSVKRHIKDDSEDLVLYNFYVNEKKDIQQIEAYRNKLFPIASFSAIIYGSIISLGEDTLRTRMEEGTNQVTTYDKRNKPINTWIYDEQNHLKQFRHYQFNELGLLRIDSTAVEWENNRVKKISFRDYFTYVLYDSTGNVSRVDNYLRDQVLNRYTYKYVFDQKGNWISLEIQIYDPVSNSNSRKYYISRQITYR